MSESAEKGKIGLFNVDSRVAIGSMGPLDGGTAFSCILEFNTANSNDHMILVSYSHAWSSRSSKDMFLMTLAKGRPRVYLDRNTYIQVDNSYFLSDGAWHKIFIKMPSKSCLLSKVQMYVDGKLVQTTLVGDDRHLYFTSTGYLTLGGWGYSSDQFSTTRFYKTLQNFQGAMNMFALWMKNEENYISSVEDGFRIYPDRRCQRTFNTTKLGVMSSGECLERCKSNELCNGFEARIRKNKPDKPPACFIFSGNVEPRASKDSRFRGGRCATRRI